MIAEPPIASAKSQVQNLERDVARLDHLADALVKERDELRRTNVAMAEEYSSIQANTVRQLEEAQSRANSVQELNRQLVRQLEEVRGTNRALEKLLSSAHDEVAAAQERLSEARQKVAELEAGVEPEIPLLREQSARARAVDAAFVAQIKAEQDDLDTSHAYAAVAQAWATIAHIPEK